MHSNAISRRKAAALFLAAATALPALAQEPPVQQASTQHSEVMPLVAHQSLVLGLVEADSRAIAVGERGHVLVSESRSEWRQVEQIPTRATLTAVDAVGDSVWAVGHDGTIIASRDGGLSWVLQRSDVLDTSADAVFDPHQGVPLLDVLMLDAQRGFAVGAYAQLLRTDDGGSNWYFVPTDGSAPVADGFDPDEDFHDQEQVDDDSWTLSDEDLMLDEESEPHFNAITRTGSGALVIVGERGAAYRSRDDGSSWERLQLPYGGSMFGVIGYEGDHVVAFGMRGNIYESRDLGDSWDQIDADTDLSLMGGVGWGDGGFALVGANGIVVTRSASDTPPKVQIHTNANQETPVLAGVIVRPNRSLVVSGDKGVDQFTPRNQ